ncbi:MAG: DUF4126 domain-containing protein [Pseudomonadales bacterium]
MEQYQDIIQIIALSMGVAWASGLNLYAAILTLGIAGSTGNIDLPVQLEILQDPMVLMAAGFMFCVEFFADKFPGVDTGWDALHTFIRIPAGAFLAASAVGETTAAMELAAAITGGSLAAGTHLTKAGTRLLINTSPEPVTNWTASFAEDFAVIGGLILALHNPVLFLILLVLFIALAIWLLPKIWRGIKLLFAKIRQWFGGESAVDEQQALAEQVNDNLQQLDRPAT